jgi:type IV secretory pathway VirB9-like protein
VVIICNPSIQEVRIEDHGFQSYWAALVRLCLKAKKPNQNMTIITKKEISKLQLAQKIKRKNLATNFGKCMYLHCPRVSGLF